MGVKFGTEFSSSVPNFTPIGVQKPQNRPMSKLNNRGFALRAMLPVYYEAILYRFRDIIVYFP